MGILNVTPDSFSDGGDHFDQMAAIAAAHHMLAAGADMIDIGGESTRPGAPPVAPGAEQARILQVIEVLARAGATISVDTRHASTMAAALDAGATIINDVTALTHDPEALPLIAARGCPVILMHTRGTPITMHRLATYEDVTREVMQELRARMDTAVAAGIRPENIMLDPGFGFAKTAAQNVRLLRDLPRLTSLGRPLVVGLSRKTTIGALANEPDPKRRLPGSLAAALYAMRQGAQILRVHDVAETRQAITVWQALTAE